VPEKHKLLQKMQAQAHPLLAGRKPQIVDLSTLSIEQLCHWRNNSRHAIKRSRTAETLRRNQVALLAVQKEIRHRHHKQSAVTRRHKHERTIKASATFRESPLHVKMGAEVTV